MNLRRRNLDLFPGNGFQRIKDTVWRKPAWWILKRFPSVCDRDALPELLTQRFCLAENDRELMKTIKSAEVSVERAGT